MGIMGKVTKGGVTAVIMRWMSRLKFPYLFALTAILFIANLFIPDALPFIDEIIIGLVTLLLGSLRNKPSEADPESSGDLPGPEQDKGG